MRIDNSNGTSAGLTAHSANVRSMDKTLKQLATGLRVNSASDDAAGLSISERLRSQVRGSAQARKNTLDGISMLNVAEGSLNEIQAMLQRGRELSLAATTDTVTDNDRKYMNIEAQKLVQEIDRISGNTRFNNRDVLNGGNLATQRTGVQPENLPGDTFSIHVGANGDSQNALNLNYGTVSLTTMGIDSIDLSSHSGALGGISAFDYALDSINKIRGDIGSISSRLETTVRALMNSETSLQSAESQIRDTDYAMTYSTFSKEQILSQSSTSMLAQANTSRGSVMSLLR